ncbi:MAG TPA: N-6 DNA methylase [Terracidiphilus sp.]|nr:N-6 DNA methylase [Terracidiphilus sp.]
MSTRISQQQLESYLWGAATLLRGTIDAGDYKQFIFPLLFYKRLCDVFDEETQLALKESSGDKTFAAYPENHRFQVPQEAHWFEVRQTSNNVGKALQAAMRAIEKANPDKLYGIFGDAQWTNKDRLSDAMLRDLIEHFSCLELTVANLPEDELGQGYEYLIKKFADDSGHTAAEFYTNRTVVHLMTEMLEPQPGESIYDPTCGSGGMLLSCIAHLRRQKKEWRNARLYGQERNLMTSSIARMNCFLHGIEDFQIVRGDTLSEPKLVEGDRLKRFDVVLANPPYSIKQWDRDAFASDPWGRNLYGTPPQGRADYAFWQHILLSLTPKTGRCAILFPHGVLFRQEEAEMRRKLIEADVIECVLGLGPNLFYNSPMEACVVICRMNKPKAHRGRVLFINALSEVTRERTQSFLTNDHIERIVNTYQRFENEPGLARVVPLVEVRSNGGNLSIPMYIASGEAPGDSSAAENTSNVGISISSWIDSTLDIRVALSKVLGETFEPMLDPAAKAQLALPAWLNRSEWRQLPFGQFAESINERVEPADAAEEIYVGLDDLDPESLHLRRWGKGSDVIGTKLRFRKGDIIFGRRRAYQRKLVLAEFDGICSAHAMVVRAKPEVVLPKFLPFLMTSNKFMSRAVEISVGSLSPTINWTTLKLEKFDLPPLHQQRLIAEIFGAIDSSLVEARSVFDCAKDFGKLYLHSLFQYQGPNSQKTAFGLIKGDWRLSTIEREGDVQLGQQKHPKYDFGTNVRPYLRVNNVRDGWIDQSDVLRMHFPESELPKFELSPGDILLNEGQTLEYLGRSAIYQGEIPGCCFQKTLIRFRCGESLLPEYSHAFFRFLLYSGFFATHAAQTAIAHVTAIRFKRMQMPVPPMSEQKCIVEELKHLEALKETCRVNHLKIREMASSLMGAFVSNAPNLTGD